MNNRSITKILSFVLCIMLVCTLSFSLASCTSDNDADASGDAIEYETNGDASGNADASGDAIEDESNGDASGDASGNAE